MPKQPYYFPKLPDTATVSYFNEAEWNKDLTPDELKQQEAIEASYIAEWEEWGKIAGYGPGFGEWFVKTTISVGAGIILGPAAIPVGAAIWGTSKIMEDIADKAGDEDAKKAFGFIGGVAGSTALGSLGGELLGGVTGAFGDQAAKQIARHGGRMTNGARVLLGAEKVAEVCEAAYEAYGDASTHAKIANEMMEHRNHRSRGIEYQYDCEICRS